MTPEHLALLVAVLVYVALCAVYVRRERRHGERCECIPCVRRRALAAMKRLNDDDRAQLAGRPVVSNHHVK